MNTNYLLVGTGCLILAVGVANCQVVKPAPAQPTAPTPARGFAGKVIETIDAAAYTYVLVDTGTAKLWVAAPQFKVRIGDSVTVPDPLPMPKFHSQTLNRDFDVVYFTGGVGVNGTRPAVDDKAAKVPPGHPPVGNKEAKMPAGHPPTGDKAAHPNVNLAGIKKAAGGKTIQEICTDRAKLNGKPVKVRGKVVKYSAKVMGKNWVHIQDGTGSAGSNDLLLTAATTVKVGDIILATGTVVTDKDFGHGYKYAVMIDNAKVVVEQAASQ